MSEETRRYGVWFWIAFVVGWLVIVYAVVQILNAKTGFDGAWRLGVWVAVGHAVNDFLFVPVVVLVGWVQARLLAPRWRAPVRFGLTASVAVVAVAYPALRGFGRNPLNRSIQPLDYPSAVLTALAVVWFLVALWLVVRAVAAHR